MFTPTDKDENGQALSLADLMGLIRRRWWLFIPPIVIAVTVISVLTVRTTPLYRAEAEVVIRTEETANLFPLSDVSSLLRSPSAEEGFLASTEYQEQSKLAAGSSVDVSLDIGDVTNRVEPSFITFTAVAADPASAASIAQAWADTYISMRHDRDVAELSRTIRTLERSIADLTGEKAVILQSLAPIDQLLATTTDTAEVTQLTTQRLALLQSLASELAPVESEMALVNNELANLHLIENFISSQTISARINRVATAPSAPFAPSIPRNLAFAVGLGLLLGAAAAFFVESTDDRIRRSSDIENRVGLQSLAAVHHLRKDDGAVHVVESGQVAEAFHRLASALDFATINGSPNQVLMFTSGRSAEGKTTTVARLAVTLAKQGRRTLVIGADLRRPTLGQRLGHQAGPGLGEILSGLYGPESCISDSTGYANLGLLPAGNIPDGRNPAELLRSPIFEATLEQLRGSYDHILIDCPPILPVVDALVLTDLVDGIIFNAFANRTKLKDVSRSLSLIRQATTTPIIGFVLNGANSKAEGYTNDNQYYSRPPIPLDRRKNRSDNPVVALPVASVDLTDSDSVVSMGANNHETGGASPATATLPRVAPHKIDFVSDQESPTSSADAAKKATPPTSVPSETNSKSTTTNGSKSKTGAKTTTNNQTNKRKNSRKSRRARKMKKTMVTLLTVLAVLLPGGAAGAQTYEGTDLEDGIFFVPDNPSAGDEVNFAATGLLPNSELTITLLDSNSDAVAGISVAGAIVVPVGPSGAFNDDIRLPPSLPAGAYTIEITGTRADLSPFETQWSFVVNESSTASAPADGQLAFTGNESSSRAYSGVLLVVLGLGLVAVSTSRRRNDAVDA